MEEVSALKIRIKFSKEGTMKFIGHLDIMRYFQKVMRRADVDIRYSEGFSPHQIMSFAAPLGVGVESLGEYVDIEVHSTDSSCEMVRRIGNAMADGMQVLSYRRLPDTSPAAMSIVAAADYLVRFREGYEPADWGVFADGLGDFLCRNQITILKQTKKGEREIDIRPLIYELRQEMDEQAIFMKIAAGSAANLKPEAVMSAYLESRGENLRTFALKVTRLEVYADLGKGGKHRFVSLESLGEDIE